MLCRVVSDWHFTSQKTASLMHTAHLNAKRKKADNVPSLFGNNGGLARSLLLLQCLFVAEELAGAHGRLVDKTHIHTHTQTT